jgi:hypothetical protein
MQSSIISTGCNLCFVIETACMFEVILEVEYIVKKFNLNARRILLHNKIPIAKRVTLNAI